jgi:hypothetical protein
MTKSKQL